MSAAEFFYTIEKESSAEYKHRGSRFIGYSYGITSVDDFKKRLEEIKKVHPKATHHCYAYRIGLEGNTHRVSDDGEPSGTAGKPILNQIDSKNLTNILIIVVRYFGGSLLGVPGLINAYKSTASMVLQLSPIVTKAIEEEFTLTFDYTQMNEVMIVIKQLTCTVITKDVNLFCRMDIGVARSKVDEAIYRFADLRAVELKKKR